MFELSVAVFNMPVFLYRLCSIRYIVFIVAGIQYVKNKDLVNRYTKKICLLCIGIGSVVIYYLNYLNINTILFRQWTTTSLPTVIFTFGLFYID